MSVPGATGKSTLKWPEHPGEFGAEGYEKHEKWKHWTKAIMTVMNVPPKVAALFTQLFALAQGHAKEILRDRKFEGLDFEASVKLFDDHFQADEDQLALVAKAEYEKVPRRFKEPLREYFRRYGINKKKWREKEPTCSFPPRLEAMQLLRHEHCRNLLLVALKVPTTSRAR